MKRLPFVGGFFYAVCPPPNSGNYAIILVLTMLKFNVLIVKNLYGNISEIC
jgi:hypothetical protein